MYLQMLDRLTGEDMLHAHTGQGLYEGRRLIVMAQRGIPNEGCAKVIEEGDLVIGAGRLHKGQSIQLRSTIS